jgi:hypothetical protein
LVVLCWPPGGVLQAPELALRGRTGPGPETPWQVGRLGGGGVRRSPPVRRLRRRGQPAKAPPVFGTLAGRGPTATRQPADRRHPTGNGKGPWPPVKQRIEALRNEIVSE